MGSGGRSGGVSEKGATGAGELKSTASQTGKSSPRSASVNASGVAKKLIGGLPLGSTSREAWKWVISGIPAL
jgi:hypothetical protein